VFRSSAVDRALDEEMQFHIQSRVDDLVAAGMTRQAAEVAASRQFGNRLRIRESSRDVKLVPWVESVLKDIRFALRMFRKHIVVTGAAIASLTLALGASLTAFSLIDALILRPLPVRGAGAVGVFEFPDRLTWFANRFKLQLPAVFAPPRRGAKRGRGRALRDEQR
jgi:hypothetical protein